MRACMCRKPQSGLRHKHPHESQATRPQSPHPSSVQRRTLTESRPRPGRPCARDRWGLGSRGARLSSPRWR